MADAPPGIGTAPTAGSLLPDPVPTGPVLPGTMPAGSGPAGPVLAGAEPVADPVLVVGPVPPKAGAGLAVVPGLVVGAGLAAAPVPVGWGAVETLATGEPGLGAARRAPGDADEHPAADSTADTTAMAAAPCHPPSLIP